MFLQAALRNLGAGWWVIGLIVLAVIGMGEARADGDKVAATVNNDVITEAEFFWRLQTMRGADFVIPTNPPSIRNETAGYIMLNSLINERVILQLAAKSHLLPSDADVDAELAPLLKQENVHLAIMNHEVTKDDLRYNIRVQKSRFNLAANGATVTQAEVEQYYNENKKNYTVPERWGLAGIRTSKLEDATNAENELSMKKPFAEVAKKYSEDQASKNNGGTIGVVNAGDPQLPKQIRDQVKDLKTGQVSPPIESDFQAPDGNHIKVYWIIKMELKQPESIRPLEDVRPQVERLAILKKVGGLEAAEKKILDFRNNSDIKIILPGYTGLLNKKP